MLKQYKDIVASTLKQKIESIKKEMLMFPSRTGNLSCEITLAEGELKRLDYMSEKEIFLMIPEDIRELL